MRRRPANMGKKFPDKKNSATFQLLARGDSFPAAPSSPAGPAADRVFVRDDNDPHYAAPGPLAGKGDPDENGRRDADEADPYSIFADALEDTDDEDAEGRGPPPAWGGPRAARPCASALPGHVGKEMLEVGPLDGGYNYLVDLREIRKAGSVSDYYENSKGRLNKLLLDVRAYDASRLRINSEVVEAGGGDSMYDVAAKTVSEKVEKVVDPDVVRLLDDSDLSRFGSAVKDLEEDFVVMANRVEEGEEEGISGSRSVSGSAMPPFKNVASEDDESLREEAFGFENHVESMSSHGEGEAESRDNQKQKPRRPLDEQFDQMSNRSCKIARRLYASRHGSTTSHASLMASEKHNKSTPAVGIASRSSSSQPPKIAPTHTSPHTPGTALSSIADTSRTWYGGGSSEGGTDESRYIRRLEIEIFELKSALVQQEEANHNLLEANQYLLDTMKSEVDSLKAAFTTQMEEMKAMMLRRPPPHNDHGDDHSKS